MIPELYIPILHSLPKIGSGTLRKLSQTNANFGFWWNASKEDFQSVLGKNGEAVYKNLQISKQKIDLKKVEEFFIEQGIRIITENHNEYPQELKEIEQSPFVLYWRGSTHLPSSRVAIVGTRKYSSYGENVTKIIGKDLSQSNVSIVSGLALGIDSLAHKAAVDVEGHTIAVLGGGCDDKTIYPATNRGLAQRILETGGAIISEHPPGTRPRSEYFPMRNRIVSGLSQGVIIIEAGVKSGTMITANLAKKQLKPLFAVPGSILNKNSAGTHYLIREGAHLITSAEDVLEVISRPGSCIENQQEQPFIGSNEEYNVYRNLQEHPEGLTLNQLSENLHKSAAELMGILTMLEISEYISQNQTGSYISLGNFIQSKKI